MKAYHVTPARGMVKLDAMENPHRLPAGLARLAPAILPLARAEGLEAHAESIEVRLT